MKNIEIIAKAYVEWEFSSNPRPDSMGEALDLADRLVEENVSLQLQIEAVTALQQSFADQLAAMRRELNSAISAAWEKDEYLKTLMAYAKDSKMSGVDQAITHSKSLIGKL